MELVRMWKSRRRIQDTWKQSGKSLINAFLSPGSLGWPVIKYSFFPPLSLAPPGSISGRTMPITGASYLGVGHRSFGQIANFAMQKGCPSRLHRDVRDGVVIVRIVHSLQLIQIAEPQGLPIRRYAVRYSSV